MCVAFMFMFMFMLMVMSLTAMASEPDLQLPPNIKSLIELPGKHDAIGIFIPAETDANDFFNKTGLYADKKFDFLVMNTEYLDVQKTVQNLKKVDGGSLLTLNIENASIEGLKIYNKAKTYYVSYDYAYGYVYKVKLGIIVKTALDYVLKNSVVNNYEQTTEIQKEYIKEKFKDYLITAGYKEDKPFLEIFSTPNEKEQVYLKYKSIVKINDNSDSGLFSRVIEVSFESKDVNDNLEKIKAEKNLKLNEEKYKELNNVFKQ